MKNKKRSRVVFIRIHGNGYNEVFKPHFRNTEDVLKRAGVKVEQNMRSMAFLVTSKSATVSVCYEDDGYSRFDLAFGDMIEMNKKDVSLWRGDSITRTIANWVRFRKSQRAEKRVI